ncbi:hypothetical protein N7488_012176 [Penicillium malachiteum]|nr:hypothetical protein N7488_012176 [Penicillium malachiteum]
MASAEISSEDTADFGDVAKDFDEEAELEEYNEPWQRYDTKYTQCVIYPIYLGEILNERYQVEKKLGFGGDYIVWMAFDLQKKKDVALKVMVLGEWADNEARIQDEIIKSVRDTSHLVLYTDAFLFPRDNKSYHRVLVFPLKGPAVSTLILDKISMAARMWAAKQLLETVAILHDAGIMHRELHVGNQIHRWSKSNRQYEILGRPVKEPIPFIDWKRGELVSCATVPEKFRADEFYLCDFGLAKKVGDLSTQSGHPPVEYCSPERFHQHEPSFACDMWSFMVVFGMLYIGFPPFSSFNGEIISNIVQSLGPLPESGKVIDSRFKSSKAPDAWYDESLSSELHTGRLETLPRRVARLRSDADPVEQELVVAIMMKVFIIEPEKRLTSRQLLNYPEWRALMDRYGC